MDQLTIRKAVAADTPTLLTLIKELATFEKLAHEVTATEDVLRRSLFEGKPNAEAILAEQRGHPVGFAIYFHNFSTFLGKPGLYLEDLYVRPEHRGHGVGIALLKAVATVAVERDCGRMEWAVLDWNQKAIDLYLKLGAKPKNDWTIFRLDKIEMSDLAARNP